MGYKENYLIIKEIVLTFTTPLCVFGDKTEIICWYTKNYFSFLPRESFPEDVPTIAKLFKGFRGGIIGGPK